MFLKLETAIFYVNHSKSERLSIYLLNVEYIYNTFKTLPSETYQMDHILKSEWNLW